MSARVWRPSVPSHLGNLWASCHYLLQQSIDLDEVVLMTRIENDYAEECLSLIDSLGRVSLVHDRPTACVDDLGEALWSVPYFPTKLAWVPRRHHKVCYQFDGRTRPSQTNPPPEDERLLLGPWLPPGTVLVKLGRPLTATESAMHLATCDAFLGVDSGISHLAHSVGVPTFLLQYAHPLTQAHPGKVYTPCYGAADAIEKICRYLW